MNATKIVGDAKIEPAFKITAAVQWEIAAFRGHKVISLSPATTILNQLEAEY